MPKPVLIACREPHRSIMIRLAGPAAVSSSCISRLFVGMIAKNVTGQFAIIKAAPITQAG